MLKQKFMRLIYSLLAVVALGGCHSAAFNTHRDSWNRYSDSVERYHNIFNIASGQYAHDAWEVEKKYGDMMQKEFYLMEAARYQSWNEPEDTTIYPVRP